MAHVLIGFAEALPAPEVVFSLLDAGHRVSVFARNTGLPLAHLPVELHVLPAPEVDAAAAISALRTVMSGPDAPDVLLPLDDVGLWLSDAAIGEDHRSAGASSVRAVVALDKARQVEAATAAGLCVPPTLVVTAPSDLEVDVPLPAIAKPALAVRLRDGRLGKGDASYLPDRAAVDALRDSLKPGAEPLLIQPLLAGVGEGVFGHAFEDGVMCWSGHRRLRMMNPHGSGSSACLSMTPDPDLRARIEDFLSRIGWRGPFMVELLRDAGGTPWFMELNGRMWGSMALARRQGLEYPAWAVAQTLDPTFRPVVPTAPEKPFVERHLGRDLLHLLFVLKGPKSDFHRAGWPVFWRSLIEVFRPAPLARFYNYDPAHKLYFLRDAAWTVKKALRR